MINKPASEKMRIIHDTKRPMITDYINELFTDFTELHGDRYFSDDHAILGGVGYFNGTPVTVIGHRKGRTIEQRAIERPCVSHIRRRNSTARSSTLLTPAARSAALARRNAVRARPLPAVCMSLSS